MTNVHFPEHTKIRNNVTIYPFVCISNEKYPPTRKKIEPIIEENVVIGTGFFLGAGIKLGKGCIIGAGSLVLKDVETGTVVFGHPAHKQYTREEYEKKQKEFLSKI